MSGRQWKRLDAVERVIAGKLSMGDAAQILGLSKRHLRRLRRSVEKRGAAAMVHGNRGRSPEHRIADAVRDQIARLWRTTYVGFNDHHFTEKLAEREGLELSRQTVRRILRSAGIAAVRKRRPRKYRGRRERKEQPGLMLLWDGSLHDWLEGRGPQMCLMAAIDDASGDIMPGAHFVSNECSASYLRVLLTIGRVKGLAWSIYMDRHGSLHRNDDHWTLEEELEGVQAATQVGRALQELEIEPIFALSPEAKGRVERMWGTLQDRLVSELRLVGAATPKEANRVLEAFIPEFNKKFGGRAKDSRSAWRSVRPGTDLERICSFRYEARVARDNTVQFEGRVVDIPAGPGGRSYACREAELRLLLSGELRVYVGKELVACQDRQPPRLSPTKHNRLKSPSTRPTTRENLSFKEIVRKLRTTTARDSSGRTKSLAC